MTAKLDAAEALVVALKVVKRKTEGGLKKSSLDVLMSPSVTLAAALAGAASLARSAERRNLARVAKLHAATAKEVAAFEQEVKALERRQRDLERRQGKALRALELAHRKIADLRRRGTDV